MYAKYKDRKRPHLAPRVFRENAPFQMKKAHDTGCCCIECEGMNELKRGSNGAAAKIEEILKRLQSSVTRSANPALTSTLAKIRYIITKPSKYESIVACLHPCLPCDGKLERAKFECIKGRQCTECGFRQLWSNDVRKAVLKDNDELRSNTLLAGPEWKESKIMWRHYTQSISNAVLADDNDEYTPLENKNACNLVLKTTNGNLIEFLDKYEETTKRHAYHRHLVSTERKASIEYDQNI